LGRKEQIVKRTWLAALALLPGCTTQLSFYPLEGPLSKEVPLLVLLATASGIDGNTGKLTLTMPDGEACSGRWSSAAGAGVTLSSMSLIGTYGSIYGTGASVSTGTGQNPGQAFMSCSKGRTFQIEFVTGAGTANGFGFAKDNQGNVYRVLF